jgi:hypothetical protein
MLLLLLYSQVQHFDRPAAACFWCRALTQVNAEMRDIKGAPGFWDFINAVVTTSQAKVCVLWLLGQPK